MLDIIRGVQDHYYFALRDDNKVFLRCLKLDLNEEDSSFKMKTKTVCIAKDFHAFEMDSSVTNDVE